MHKDGDTPVNIYDDEDFELALRSTVDRDVKEVTFIIKFSEVEANAETEQVKKSKPSKVEDPTDIPLKALQNLISKELKGQLPDMFTELIQAKNVYSVEDMKPQFECSNCGVKPIVGIRYACPECKNFNFCADCEDSVKHEHYLLKIRQAED